MLPDSNQIIADIAIELAENIFDSNTNMGAVENLISQATKHVTDPIKLLIELPRALMELKKYHNKLVDAGETEIKSNVSGYLLYENYDDPHLDVIAIIGPRKVNVSNTLVELEQATLEKTRSERIKEELRFRDNLLRKDIEIIYRHQFPNLGRYARFISNFRKGDWLAIDDVIGKLKFQNYSSKATVIYEKYHVSERYCIQLIEKSEAILNHNNIATNLTIRKSKIKTDETFETIWQGDFKVFEKLVTKLEKTTKEGGPFIIKKEESISWIMQPTNGWQKYLTAFLYFCSKYGYIKLDERLSNARLNRICQNHFKITPIDPDNLSLLREISIKSSNTLSLDYKSPFIKMFQEVKK